MTAPSLPEKVVALERALESVPHAFGGAIALAYYAEPRATIGIDLNVFVPADRFAEVSDPLSALGVAIAGGEIETVVREVGQVRVFWGSTPLDLFFAYDDFHIAAAAACRRVPFAAEEITILAAAHLVVRKAVFDRSRDWVDIDAMVERDAPIDAAEVLRWVGRIAGDDDRRFERIATVLTGR